MHLKSVCLTAAAVLAFGITASTQAAVVTTFTSAQVPVDICDTCTVTSTLNIDSHGRILDIDALLDITHSYDADLVLRLTHGGITVLLADRQGGSGGANYTGTVFDDQADIGIDAGYAYAPYTGSFRPQQALAAFIDQDLFGDWTLTVTDSEAGDAGTINSWGISATTTAATAVPEPASLALFGLGLAGLALPGRRRKA